MQAKMLNLSYVFVFVLSMLTVKAFPNARQGGSGKAYVVYRMPSRCVDAPPNDICDLGYKIRNMGGQDFNAIVRASFGWIKDLYKNLGFSDVCIENIMKLMCRNAFPECLPNGRIDYGDQHQIIDEINKQCKFKGFNKTSFKAGIHKDPYSSHTFKCVNVPQDPDQKCPKPNHPMLVSQAKDYYERIRNISNDASKDKYPSECFKKAFNVFACSYVFCSSDKQALLMEATEQDCRDVGECLKKYGQYDKDAAMLLDEVCPNYPSADRNEEVYPPY